MSYWPSTKAKKIRRALESIGWTEKPTDKKGSSHCQLVNSRHPELGEYTWSFQDGDELGPKIISKIAKKTGLTPQDI